MKESTISAIAISFYCSRYWSIENLHTSEVTRLTSRPCRITVIGFSTSSFVKQARANHVKTRVYIVQS